jgi:hypothetical protein
MLLFSRISSIFSTASAVYGSVAYAASIGSAVTPVSPTSFVRGHAFDRFVIITLEHTDKPAAGDRGYSSYCL